MKVKLFANLRNICGDVAVKIEPEGKRIIDILEQMVEMFPELNEEIFTEKKTLKPFVHIYVNGKNILHGENLETVVQETDEIALFPPVAGG